MKVRLTSLGWSKERWCLSIPVVQVKHSLWVLGHSAAAAVVVAVAVEGYCR